MRVVKASGAKYLAPKFNFFSLLVLSKTDENKNLIKNDIILIFKSLLEECTLKQSLSFKPNHNCLD